MVLQVVLQGRDLYTCPIICDVTPCGNDDATTSSTSNVHLVKAPRFLPSTASKGPTSVATSQTPYSAAPEHTFSAKAVLFRRPRLDPWCEQWGVVTTNYESSEAVRCWMRVEGWCLVIVSDGKSLNKYETQWT